MFRPRSTSVRQRRSERVDERGRVLVTVGRGRAWFGRTLLALGMIVVLVLPAGSVGVLVETL